MKERAILSAFWALVLVLAPSQKVFAQADTLEVQHPFVTDVRELLVGQTPGVVAVSSLGAPGMTPSVYVRGIHLFEQNPVFYVDGSLVNDLSFIAPESIVSIDVLSGSEAVLRFGPDAAVGALSITTRNASRAGFHASYSFTGAVQQLAWEPAQVSLEEWKSFFYKSRTDVSQNPFLLDRYGTSFAQNHHLNLLYGTNKLNVAAALDFLDNDGPQEGRKDTHRRISGTARIGYRPMEWFLVELSTAAGQSDINKQYLLNNFLTNEPLRVVASEDPLANNDKLGLRSGITTQAKLELRPIEDFSFRAIYGLSREKTDDYSVAWLRELNQAAVIGDLVSRWNWNQYGFEAEYSPSFGDHSLQLNLGFKRQDYENPNLTVSGGAIPEEYGIQWGDSRAIDTKYLEQFLTRILKQEEFPITGANYSFKHWKDKLTDLSFRLGYDWNKHLFAEFGVYQRWRKSIAKDIKSPSLAASLRWDSGKNWKLFGSWSQARTFYSDLFNAIPLGVSTIGTAVFTRMDAGADLTFPIGNHRLDFRLKGFLDKDQYSYDKSSHLTIDNSGLELAAGWSGRSGDFRFDTGASITLYKNKVSDLFDGYEMIRLSNAPLTVRKGYPVGIAWLTPLQGILSNGAPDLGSAAQAFGKGFFPTAVLGVQGSLAWKNWQFSVSGHGNFGQSILRTTTSGALTRHYLENSWREDHQNALYPAFGYFSMWEYTQSSAMLHKGSFFRIDMVRLNYSLPVHNFGGNLDFFASLENFFLFSSYPGSDPELSLDWNNLGLETAGYPSSRRVVFGVKISL